MLVHVIPKQNHTHQRTAYRIHNPHFGNVPIWMSRRRGDKRCPSAYLFSRPSARSLLLAQSSPPPLSALPKSHPRKESQTSSAAGTRSGSFVTCALHLVNKKKAKQPYTSRSRTSQYHSANHKTHTTSFCTGSPATASHRGPQHMAHSLRILNWASWANCCTSGTMCCRHITGPSVTAVSVMIYSWQGGWTV